MAKPKKSVLVKVIGNPVEPIEVWINNASLHLSDIASIEGVRNVYLDGETKVKVTIDARYNIDEIAQELRELLAAEVSDIFKE